MYIKYLLIFETYCIFMVLSEIQFFEHTYIPPVKYVVPKNTYSNLPQLQNLNPLILYNPKCSPKCKEAVYKPRGTARKKQECLFYRPPNMIHNNVQYYKPHYQGKRLHRLVNRAPKTLSHTYEKGNYNRSRKQDPRPPEIPSSTTKNYVYNNKPKYKNHRNSQESDEYENKYMKNLKNHKLVDEKPNYVRDHAPENYEEESVETKASGELSNESKNNNEATSLELSPDGDRVEFQIRGHDGPQSYVFGFDTGDSKNRQYRLEERFKDGTVKGHYGYYDAKGKLRKVNYVSSPTEGYQEKHHESNARKPENE
ncbi:uncharacterized protein [Prorops nasuta]|uniref:uncharacterized protein n=1 Tax=Prorops nasuta TaxID=863751 RepID=UPI0034CE2E38